MRGELKRVGKASGPVGRRRRVEVADDVYARRIGEGPEDGRESDVTEALKERPEDFGVRLRSMAIQSAEEEQLTERHSVAASGCTDDERAVVHAATSLCLRLREVETAWIRQGLLRSRVGERKTGERGDGEAALRRLRCVDTRSCHLLTAA